MSVEPIRKPPNIFRSFEEACAQSRLHKAVGDGTIERAALKGSARRNAPPRVPVQIIKPLNGDAYIVYRNSGVKIRQATKAEVDAVRFWKPY